MMLRDVLDWAKNRLSPSVALTREQSQGTAQEARETRATLITGLQAEVRKIQQSITDLSGLLGTGTDGPERQTNVSRLTALEHDLGEKQRELSRYQGRI